VRAGGFAEGPSAFGRIDRARSSLPRRLVEEVTAPEHVASGWWNEPYALVYRWALSNDGARALFCRAAPSPAPAAGDARAIDPGAWRLVGVAD
jgi:hypothetical protein